MYKYYIQWYSIYMKANLQKQAVQLRKNGTSIKDIAKYLCVSQSTVSRWCAGIALSNKQRQALEEKRRAAGAAALKPWIQKRKKMSADDIKNQKELGKNDLGALSKRDLYMLGLGLYWGEGYKKGSQEWGFVNSDPHIIRTIIEWLHTCYEVPISRINARLTINELYAKNIDEITRTWSKETGLQFPQFRKPSIIKGYGNPSRPKETYRGTLRIKVSRGTSLRRRVLASISAVPY